MMEPTDNAIHAGCLGNINATWTFTGRAGHSARPWHADNAIHKAARAIAPFVGARARGARVRRPEVLRGGLGDDDLRRDRHQRRPGQRHRRGQLPLRPRPLARGGRGAARRAVPRGARRDLQLAVRARAARQPARRAAALAPATGRPSRRGRRWPSSAAPASTRSTSAPASPPQAHQADESVRDRRASIEAYRVLEAFARVRLSPVLAGLRTYPFLQLNEAKRQLAAARRGLRRLRDRRAARGDAGLHPRGAGGGDRAARAVPVGRRAARSCAPRSPAWARAPLRRRARPGHRGRADARLQGGDLPPRPGGGRRAGRGADAVVPGLRARRGVRGQASCWSCRCGPSNGFLPDLDAVDAATWARVAVLWLNYPNNPTAATATLEFYERRRRWPASTTSCWPATRPTRSCTSAPTRRCRRCRSPTAPTCSSSTRCPSARRCPATAPGFAAGDPEVIAALRKYRPNVGVAPLEMVQRAAVVAWGDEAHVDAVRDTYRAKRDVVLPALERRRVPQRGRRRDVLPVARGRRGARLAAAGGRRRGHARALLRRRRRGLRPARARAVARGLRARRRAAERASSSRAGPR